jgi:adenylate kinase family enzyme
MEGADGTGKTTIGKELAKVLGFTYFSNRRPTTLDMKSPSTVQAHLTALEFGYGLIDALKANVVLDRGHASEFV